MPKQKQKFTPGPWRVRDHRDRSISALWVDAPNAVIPNNRGPSYTRQILEDEDYPEKLADAYLVAAAPELLAALKAVVAVADRDSDEFNAAKAAISKAEQQ